MGDLVEVVAGEIDEPRVCLHGRDLEPDDVAAIAQASPTDRADAAGAAGHVPADRGGVVGRGMQAQLLRRLPSRLLIHAREDCARFRHHAARRHFRHLLHAGKIEHHAARQRHGLPVIAGAAAARRQRDLQLEARRHHLRELGLVRRRDDDVAGHRIELPLEHRRVPVEVPALLAHQRGIVLEPDAGDALLQPLDVIGWHGGMARWWRRGDRARGSREGSYRWRGLTRRPRGRTAGGTPAREACGPGS